MRSVGSLAEAEELCKTDGRGYLASFTDVSVLPDRHELDFVVSKIREDQIIDQAFGAAQPLVSRWWVSPVVDELIEQYEYPATLKYRGK